MAYTLLICLIKGTLSSMAAGAFAHALHIASVQVSLTILNLPSLAGSQQYCCKDKVQKFTEVGRLSVHENHPDWDP